MLHFRHFLLISSRFLEFFLFLIFMGNNKWNALSVFFKFYLILFSETEIIFTILHPVGFHPWNTKGIQYKCECCTTLVHKSVWSRLVGFKGETVIFLRAALILNSVALSLAEKDNLVFLVLLGLLDPLPGTVQIYSGMNRCLEKKSYYISPFSATLPGSVGWLCI